MESSPSIHQHDSDLPISLLQLLSNSLVLHQTTPYLPLASLLALGATSKEYKVLVHNTPNVFRHVDLTKVKSAQFEIAAIDHGGEVWRNVQLDENVTEDEFVLLSIPDNFMLTKLQLLWGTSARYLEYSPATQYHPRCPDSRPRRTFGDLRSCLGHYTSRPLQRSFVVDQGGEKSQRTKITAGSHLRCSSLAVCEYPETPRLVYFWPKRGPRSPPLRAAHKQTASWTCSHRFSAVFCWGHILAGCTDRCTMEL